MEVNVSPTDFPFTPYQGQIDFSNDFYNLIQQGGLGIFESPTGTGKSMGIIMGSCKWLENNEKNFGIMFEQNEGNKNQEKKSSSDTKKNTTKSSLFPDWLNPVAIKRENFLSKMQVLYQSKELLLNTSFTQKDLMNSLKNNTNTPLTEKVEKKNEIFDENFQLDYKDCDIKDEQSLKNLKRVEDLYKARKKLDNCEKDKKILYTDDEKMQIKKENSSFRIVYSSRTHSQIREFISELKKTKYSHLKVVHLGSRANLCIEPSVKNIGNNNSQSMINENCKLLRESTKKCQFYKKIEIENTKDYIFDKILDIEDANKIFTKNNVCPYYSTRSNSYFAQILCVPYNMIINKSMRDSQDIDLKNSILVFDEAHNLVDNVIQNYNHKITYLELIESNVKIKEYIAKYRNRLKAKNVYKLDQIACLFENFMDFIKSHRKLENKEKEYFDYKLQEVLLKLKVIDYDLFDLKNFIDSNQLSRKLNYFSAYNKKPQNDVEIKIHQKNNENDEKSEVTSRTVTSIEKFLNLLSDLLGASTLETKILIKIDKQKFSNSEFVLMNFKIDSFFENIIEKSHAVLLTGGTMKPLGQLNQLLGNYAETTVFRSFPHVIKDDQFKCQIVKQLGNIKFNFSYENRGNKNMTREVLNCIQKLCKTVKDGVIIFLPSYSFLNDQKNEVIVLFNNNQVDQNIFMSNKKVFFDSNEQSAAKESKNLFDDYKLYMDKKDTNRNGAVLFSVMGGKLSEGINFKDHLARLVICISLPYPNIKSPEIIERMDFYNKENKKTIKKLTGKEAEDQKFTGNDFYQNLCSRVVNQSIGRAIRHKNDYAMIILQDERYAKNSVRQNLPGWVLNRCYDFEPNSLEKLDEKVKSFFINKNE